MELVIGFWIVCAIVSGIIASSRGLNGCGYTVLGFLLGPFGVLMACVIPPGQTANVRGPNAFVGDGFELRLGRPSQPALPMASPMSALRTCPECLSEIPAAARVCRYCQRESTPDPETEIVAATPCYGGAEHQWVWSEVYHCWRCAKCYTYQKD